MHRSVLDGSVSQGREVLDQDVLPADQAEEGCEPVGHAVVPVAPAGHVVAERPAARIDVQVETDPRQGLTGGVHRRDLDRPTEGEDDVDGPGLARGDVDGEGIGEDVPGRRPHRDDLRRAVDVLVGDVAVHGVVTEVADVAAFAPRTGWGGDVVAGLGEGLAGFVDRVQHQRAEFDVGDLDRRGLALDDLDDRVVAEDEPERDRRLAQDVRSGPKAEDLLLAVRAVAGECDRRLLSFGEKPVARSNDQGAGLVDRPDDQIPAAPVDNRDVDGLAGLDADGGEIRGEVAGGCEELPQDVGTGREPRKGHDAIVGAVVLVD